MKLKKSIVILSSVAILLASVVAPMSAFAESTKTISTNVNASESKLNIIDANQMYPEIKTNNATIRFENANEVYRAHGSNTKNIDLAQLPVGTAVIKVNSLDELDALLTNTSNSIHQQLNQNIKLTPPTHRIRVVPNIALSAPVARSKTSVLYDAKTWWVNLTSNYVLTNVPDGSWSGKWIISSSTASTTLNGFTFAITWTQSAATSTKITDYKWYSTASGTISFVVFFQGLGTIVSSGVSGSHFVEI